MVSTFSRECVYSSKVFIRFTVDQVFLQKVKTPNVKKTQVGICNSSRLPEERVRVIFLRRVGHTDFSNTFKNVGNSLRHLSAETKT